MSKRQKGERRERQARDMYRDAGYRVEKVNPLRYGRSDWFNLWDLMTIDGDGNLTFVQVRSNQAQNPREWFKQSRELVNDSIGLHLQICYDRQGWRLLEPSSNEKGYTTSFDERGKEGNMGECMTEYLR